MTKPVSESKNIDTKTLLWMICPQNALLVLVPKKRGKGFLSQPYGHHHNKELDNVVCDAVGDLCDVWGLDGYLDIHADLEAISEKDNRKASEIMDALAKYYGFPHRKVHSSEFWRYHPVIGKDGLTEKCRS